VNDLTKDVSFVDITFICKLWMTFLKIEKILADTACRLSEATTALCKLENLEVIENREKVCDTDAISVCVFVISPLNDRLEAEERNAEINFAVMPWS
jgi:hypothetical protein